MKAILVGTPRSEGDSSTQLTDEDLAMLQFSTVLYYLHETNPDNGLVRDKTDPSAPASIAAMGMALATIPVIVERGILFRDFAVKITRKRLRYLFECPQGPERHRRLGRRRWRLARRRCAGVRVPSPLGWWPGRRGRWAAVLRGPRAPGASGRRRPREPHTLGRILAFGRSALAGRRRGEGAGQLLAGRTRGTARGIRRSVGRQGPS